MPWAKGKPMAWDVTVPDTYAESHVGDTATKPGAAAHKAAENKVTKYDKLAATHVFYPFAIETDGTWDVMAIELTQEIGRRITSRDQGDQGESILVFNACHSPWLFKEGKRSPSNTHWHPNEMSL